jgi:hypothetical protein
MTIAVPALRLLLACFLLIVGPIVLGVHRVSVAWLLLPGAVLTFISCYLQGYRKPGVVALCAASTLAAMAALYAAARLGAEWL